MNPAIEQGVLELIALAVREDLGRGDITSALLSARDAGAEFRLCVKQPGVFAGAAIVTPVLHAFDPQIQLEWLQGVGDGTVMETVPTDVAVLRGALGKLLAAERVLLNFLQRLCGIATHTHAFVRAIEGSGAKIYDTRKTVPGWRVLDKYAVRCGGGANHRRGLHDAVLIKDNHLVGVPTAQLAHTVFSMLNQVDARTPPSFVEVEAQSLAQVPELLKVVGIDVILLDNFTTEDLAEAVELRNALGLRGKVALEASGGITLHNVRAVADTGVERISVGAITHSAPALDISLERA